jgi:hypothetical protein
MEGVSLILILQARSGYALFLQAAGMPAAARLVQSPPMPVNARHLKHFATRACHAAASLSMAVAKPIAQFTSAVSIKYR